MFVLKHSSNVAGDENCLFNAFALAFCGSQSFSGVVRDAIVAHMISPEYRDEIQAALVPANSQQMDQFNRHIENMLTDREWGTELHQLLYIMLFIVQ